LFERYSFPDTFELNILEQERIKLIKEYKIELMKTNFQFYFYRF